MKENVNVEGKCKYCTNNPSIFAYPGKGTHMSSNDSLFVICVILTANIPRHTGGSSRRFWGRPTWRSDPSQGTPQTKNSSDLADYFLGSGPKSRTKIKKIYKKENKQNNWLQVPGSSWKSTVSSVGP